jgi:pyruvate,orthophosphate dikinase
MTEHLVLALSQGNRSMADLLGGKGANLAEMTQLGLPVPHGFIITTDACRAYLEQGRPPAQLSEEVDVHLADLESSTGRRLGDPDKPLLVSVRSGARFSMPGMMETILNVGLTDASVRGLAARGGERFAWDCYRRLVQMYGRTVLGVDPDRFEERLAQHRSDAGVKDDSALDAGSLRALVGEFRQILRDETGEDVPQDPRKQLDRAINAVFESWTGDRARVYRRHEGIPDDLGTAVNVIEMVYGNTGPRSGSGVCFTRNPATGAAGAYGDYLPNAQGEDVVNGSRATMSLAELGRTEPAVHEELVGHLERLERHYGDLCDVEFTVEDSHLWILQTRIGKRSPAAAFVIADALVDEGIIDLDEALRRVRGAQLDLLLHARLETEEGETGIATGLPASPGAAVGEVALDPQRAVDRAAQGADVVLVREETSPDDLEGMLASVAVVTSRGGLTSHAAVVARGLGRTCVTGVETLEIDMAHRTVLATTGGEVIREGDVISVDGTAGEIYAGALPVRPSSLWDVINDAHTATETTTETATETTEQDDLSRAVLRIMAHADAQAELGVRANAETPEESITARRLGAGGIGLCRTEHMFLGERRSLIERIVLDDDREGALRTIEDLSREDFIGILEAMDGLPVVVRLLDPPLHEFLPDLVELSVAAALRGAEGREDPVEDHRLEAVRHWHEANPMLGLRGVRLLAVVPDLVEAQVRALSDATDDLRARGGDPRPEIMVPLVAEVAELRGAVERIRSVVDSATEGNRRIPVGVMIELPRAALTAGSLAEVADFFSFGTNDLTQTTWGISRDDAEAKFLGIYRTQGIIAADPFETLDTTGVGELVTLAAERGRATRPDIVLGACGEHAGDPASIHFLAAAGLDYVSCSPPRVPIARLEVGRAAVMRTGQSASTDSR